MHLTHIWRAAAEAPPDRRCSADWTGASEAGTVFGRSATPSPPQEQLPGQLPATRSITGLHRFTGSGNNPFSLPPSPGPLHIQLFRVAALAALTQTCLLKVGRFILDPSSLQLLFRHRSKCNLPFLQR